MYLRLSKSAVALTLLSTLDANAVEITEDIFTSGFVSSGTANYRTFTIDENGERHWKRDWHHIAEAGVTVSANLPLGLEFNGQVLFRDFDDLSGGSETKVDFASIDWRNAFLGYGEQTISVGRVKSGGGIYNHTRDIPFTRPSIILPNSVYAEDFRSVYSHIDGVRFASNFFIGSGELNLEFATGKPKIDEDFIGNEFAASMENSWQDDDTKYFDIRYQNAQWLLNYSRTSIDSSLTGFMTLVAISGQAISFGGESNLNLENHTYGAQYQHEMFEITAEYSKQKIDARNSLSPLSFKGDIDGYYAQFRYFISPEMSLMTRYEKLNFGIDWSIQSHSPIGLLDSKQYALGLSWRINPNWQLNVEAHKNKTDYWDEDLALMQLSWRF